MKKTYFLNINSVEKNIFSEKVRKIYINGIEGGLAILPNHCPLLTLIRPGMINIFQKDKTEKILYISGGILEIELDYVRIFADTIVRSEDLDEKKALKTKKEAENYININKNNKNLYKKNAIILSEAIAKLQIIELIKKTKIK